MRNGYIVESNWDGRWGLATRDVFSNKRDAIKRCKALAKASTSPAIDVFRVMRTSQWQAPENRLTLLDTLICIVVAKTGKVEA